MLFFCSLPFFYFHLHSWVLLGTKLHIPHNCLCKIQCHFHVIRQWWILVHFSYFPLTCNFTYHFIDGLVYQDPSAIFHLFWYLLSCFRVTFLSLECFFFLFFFSAEHLLCRSPCSSVSFRPLLMLFTLFSYLTFTSGLCYDLCLLAFASVEAKKKHLKTPRLSGRVLAVWTKVLSRKWRGKRCQQVLKFRAWMNWKDGDVESSNKFICVGLVLYLVLYVSHLNVNFHTFRQYAF